MRIAIDCSALKLSKHKGMGVRRIIENILMCWNKNQDNHEYLLYFREEDDAISRLNLNPEKFKKRVILPKNKLINFIWENTLFPISAKKDNADVIFSPCYTTPIFFDDLPKFVIVHDISYHTFVKDFSIKQRLFLDTISRISCRKARKIFTVSNFSKLEIAKNYHISEDKIVVVYSGVSDEFRPIKISEYEFINIKGKLTKQDFILYVGTMFTRRNIPKLIKAYEKILHDGYNLNLVLIGENKTAPKINLKKMIDDINLKFGCQRIIHADYVTEDILLKLMQQSSIFIYPSSYEGFGLPVLEAMACGKCVITGNTSSLPEIASDGALLVNASDDEEIYEGMKKILTDVDYSKELALKAITQASKFKWESAAAKYLEIIEKYGYKEKV